jgi:hypothetical protein
MKARALRLYLIGFSVLATMTLMAWAADEKEMSLDQIPAEAKAAILKQAGANKIAEVEQETHDGVAVYEAEWEVNGAEHEVAVLADGTVVETEEEIDAAQAPAAVRAAIEKQFGAGAKVSIDRKTVVLYEAEGKVDGKGMEVIFSPTGKSHGAEEDDAAGDDDDEDGN